MATWRAPRHPGKPAAPEPAALLTQHSLISYSTPHPEALMLLIRAQGWDIWKQSPRDWLLVNGPNMIAIGRAGAVQAMGDYAQQFMANLTSWVGGMLAVMDQVRKSIGVCCRCVNALGYPVGVDGDTLCESCWEARQ